MLLKPFKSHGMGRNRASVCPACDACEHHFLGYKLGYGFVECRKCGSIFTNLGTVEDRVFTEYYDRYYDHAHFKTPPVAAASLERLVQACKPFRSTGRWLDLGFGEGALLDAAEKQGWQCYGTEIASACLDYGERRGWVVAAEAEQSPRFPKQGFDVVTMIECLEHVPRPHRFLQAAARWLRPGGLLYVTTPNAESLNRRCLGLQWSIFRPPEHLTIWSAWGLGYALAKAGFHHLRLRTEGLNPCEILAHFCWQKQGAVMVNRNQTGLALNHAFSRSLFRRVLKAGINTCLSGFRGGDTLKVWARRDSDITVSK